MSGVRYLGRDIRSVVVVGSKRKNVFACVLKDKQDIL